MLLDLRQSTVDIFRLPSCDVVILLYRILAYYCFVIFYFLFLIFSLYKLIPWATYVRLITLWLLLLITTIIWLNCLPCHYYYYILYYRINPHLFSYRLKSQSVARFLSYSDLDQEPSFLIFVFFLHPLSLSLGKKPVSPDTYVSEFTRSPLKVSPNYLSDTRIFVLSPLYIN